MPFIKKNGSAVAVEPAQAELNSLANTAIANTKLSTTKILTPTVAKGRDFDAEARGKTRCALEQAWAQSPLIAMLLKEPQNREELHALLDEIIDARMKRIFPNG